MSSLRPAKAVSLRTSLSSTEDLDGEEVEDILRKARLSIDSTYDVLAASDGNDRSPSTSGKARRNEVTFAGIPPSPPSSIGEHKDAGGMGGSGEMLIQTQKLLEKVKQTEIDLSAERALRKKKDKNIMKLAKQLKRRNADYDENLERLKELTQLTKDLEQKLLLTQKELQQQDILHKKYTDESKKEHEKALSQQQEKYAKTCAEHDARITALSKSHAQQCEELCREILKTNLEADRLQTRINTIEGTNEQRAMPLSTPSKSTRTTNRTSRFIFLFAAALSIAVGIVHTVNKDYLCAPARLGSIIKEGTSTSFQAPWWAPESTKPLAYQTLCSREDIPMRLEWIVESGGSKIVVWKNNKSTLTKRATSVEVTAGGMRLWNKKGHGEEIATPWS